MSWHRTSQAPRPCFLRCRCSRGCPGLAHVSAQGEPSRAAGVATAGRNVTCPVGLDFELVDDDAARELRDLAERARATLVAAGLPASAGNPGPGGGAVIDVDLGADAAGGVSIAWRFPRAQFEEIANHLLARQVSHPSVQYFFGVQRAMRDAIMAILHAAGFTAVRSEDPNDIALRVLGSEPALRPSQLSAGQQAANRYLEACA
jgi:hypothetical protein